MAPAVPGLSRGGRSRWRWRGRPESSMKIAAAKQVEGWQLLSVGSSVSPYVAP
jgi:hypothetical protein